MEKNITKWLEKGFIDENIARVLLEDLKEGKEKNRKIRLNVTIYTIAVIFIGIGIITFIASNDWLIDLLNRSDFVRILLMTIATFGCFLGGYKLVYDYKKFPKLGNSLIVLSSLLIGGLYSLTGQIYNINANNSSLMLNTQSIAGKRSY